MKPNDRPAYRKLFHISENEFRIFEVDNPLLQKRKGLFNADFSSVLFGGWHNADSLQLQSRTHWRKMCKMPIVPSKVQIKIEYAPPMPTGSKQPLPVPHNRGASWF